MEFLRFGSSIPGSYWGCCAVCIIQNFKVDPDSPASIQLVSGDGGGPITKGNEMLFAGSTYRDIFKARIRVGTFSSTDMPNHGFLAVLTESQVSGGVGKKWLQILKEEGFEFLRTVDNSVYTGPGLTGSTSPHPNHIFGLFRNITGSRIKDPLTPPPAWTSLPKVVDEAWERISPEDRVGVAKAQTEVHKAAWEASGPTRLLTESEVVAAGAPVTLAGLRSKFPQESKPTRESKQALESGAVPSASKAPAWKTAKAA